MIAEAQVVKWPCETEGEVVLRLGRWEILCFGYCSLSAEVESGKVYKVDITPNVMGDYDVVRLEGGSEHGFCSLNGYAYLLKGKLSKGGLEIEGVVFDDDVFESEFFYLDGCDVGWVVDRLDVEFLERVM